MSAAVRLPSVAVVSVAPRHGARARPFCWRCHDPVGERCRCLDNLAVDTEARRPSRSVHYRTPRRDVVDDANGFNRTKVVRKHLALRACHVADRLETSRKANPQPRRRLAGFDNNGDILLIRA